MVLARPALAITTRTYNGNVAPGIDDSAVRKAELIISGVLRGTVVLSAATPLFGMGDFFFSR